MDASLHLDSRGDLVETLAVSKAPVRVHAAGGCLGRGTNGWVQQFGARWALKRFRDPCEARYEVRIARMAGCRHLVPVIPAEPGVFMPLMRPMTTTDATERHEELVGFIDVATHHLFRRGLAYTDLTPRNIMVHPKTHEFVLCDAGSLEAVRPYMPYKSTLWTPTLLEEADVIRGITYVRAPSLDCLERIARSMVRLLHRWGKDRIDLRAWSCARRPSHATLLKMD